MDKPGELQQGSAKKPLGKSSSLDDDNRASKWKRSAYKSGSLSFDQADCESGHEAEEDDLPATTLPSLADRKINSPGMRRRRRRKNKWRKDNKASSCGNNIDVSEASNLVDGGVEVKRTGRSDKGLKERGEQDTNAPAKECDDVREEEEEVEEKADGRGGDDGGEGVGHDGRRSGEDHQEQ